MSESSVFTTQPHQNSGRPAAWSPQQIAPQRHRRSANLAPALAALLIILVPTQSSADEEDPFDVPPTIRSILSVHCRDCHSGPEASAGVVLGTPDSSTSDELILWNRVQDQLFFDLMPPPEADPLSIEDKKTLTAWLRTELRRRNASELDKKLTSPEYGNYVDHEELFTGSHDQPASTPARRWLVRPEIFHERILDVFQLTGGERNNYRSRGFYGITNPFVLPDHSGVRDFDHATLDGGHLLIMLGNAKWIAEKQIAGARIRTGSMQPNEFPNPKDRWYPKAPQPAFESVISGEEAISPAVWEKVIGLQFSLVLHRSPTDAELKDYRQLAMSAADQADNTEALRQVLIGVLLESEFLYRSEFGTGPPDESGRRLLSPREAAWAIAYALGDRGPDAGLREAAKSGSLQTAADYEREITRLLNNDEWFRGPIDPTVNGGRQTMQSRKTSHPRLIRFFRNFFGYPAALKVFKDLKRSDGFYINPGRGSTQTPGHLVNEADRVVADIVEADTDVFARLLTTDRYYLYHNIDNEAGQERVRKWREVYETLKDTDWQNDPERVAEEHQELLRRCIDSRGVTGRSKARHDNSLIRLMTHFEHTFGNGNRPFTTFPWAHGNHYWHSPIYNLPQMPGQGGKYGNNDAFDYHAVQPFPVPHRKGILTHPAWLVAHSGNFQTDPIRRGKWIREKLLAGRVPDLPISVDAQVPEHPNKTFRERVAEVTGAAECRKCHQQMNPLGFPFEIFDDFGRFRTLESLEHPDSLVQQRPGNLSDIFRTAEVNASGYLTGTGDPSLDGPVGDAFELIDRLAVSRRVRQSFIRHAFRFFLGRNETLSDSGTIREADAAYVRSGGSFRAVVLSLLTSDSFRFRKPTEE